MVVNLTGARFVYLVSKVKVVSVKTNPRASVFFRGSFENGNLQSKQHCRLHDLQFVEDFQSI